MSDPAAGVAFCTRIVDGAETITVHRNQYSSDLLNAYTQEAIFLEHTDQAGVIEIGD